MRTTFFKKPIIILLTMIFTSLLAACGGGSSITNGFVDGVVNNNDHSGWQLGDFKFIAGNASKNSLLGTETITSTSLALSSNGDLVTSIVNLQYVDNGPGVYTLVSSFSELASRQAQDPQGQFLFIAASIINLANNSTEYRSEDAGFINVTRNNQNNLVFNVPSPVNLVRNSGNAFPELPFRLFFTLVDIFEDLPPPSLL